MRKLFFIAIIIFILGCKSDIDTAIERYFNNSLNDPSSLVIYNKKIVDNNKNISYWVMLDYGAKNGYGGMVRQKEYFYIIGNEVMDVVSEVEFPSARDSYDTNNHVDTISVSADEYKAK